MSHDESIEQYKNIREGEKDNNKNQEERSLWNEGLDSSDYWEDRLTEVAPVPLACSYQLLHSYVKEGNIGCTLFLIRDVFELMIKIPVVIVMDGVYTLLEEEETASSACMGKSDCMDKEDTAGTGQKNRPSVP